MNTDKHGLDFTGLVTAIREVHAHLAAQAGKAVCISLTLRNWAIGCYIREYEQEGRDRADYGKNLLQTLAISLKDDLDKCYTGRYLRLCRQLYDVYPQIRKSLISRFDVAEKGKSLISDLPEQSVLDGHLAVSEPATHPAVPVDKLIRSLSFTMLIELIKLEDFTHENVGQLNTYVSWYRKNMMADDDNPPIGLLLCTGKDHALVEYALAGMDNSLFVSKYQLELPSKDAIQRFLSENMGKTQP